MREIKFRAVRLDTGEWICGDLHLHTPFPHIHSTRGDKAKIDTNTIGQFTGLRDKNGKEVYEGDIVKFIPNSNSREFVRPIKWLGTSFTFGEMSPLNYPSDCYEVIGNVHDNPELLKKIEYGGKNMKKTLELTLQQAQSIYKTADASLKEILESNFGKRNLVGRPLGVWCLTKDNKAVKPEDWKSEYEALGVGVITDKTAFIVLPTPQAALPFGSTSVEKYDDMVYDEETYDSAAATDCIDEAHSGVNGKAWDNVKFPFVGAPAAEYCLKQGGYLPTLATAKEIAANIKSINEAMLAIGGYVVCGWLWTSTVKKSNICAFVVSAAVGDVRGEGRNDYNFARAVSAFHFENFEF